MKPTPVVLLLVVAMLTGLFPALAFAAPMPTTLHRPSLSVQSGDSLGVQAILDAQPGILKSYRNPAASAAGAGQAGQSAATIIESNSLYYGLSPRLHLALLETTSNLLSDPNPPDSALRQPFGSAGPVGFAAQIDWASRELRAGLGPYNRAPTLRFTDGTTITLALNQAPEGIAVQRFLAINRSATEWRALVERFAKVFQDYFNNELPEVSEGRPGVGQAPPDANPQAPITLLQPWPMGVRVVHLAYFDHVYPTVDSGSDGNSFVVNYLGRGNVQYNGHDGHDYYFPNQPIGTPILAAAPGIAYARTHRGNGVVIIHPGGYETVYWHLDRFAPIFDGKIDTNQGMRVEVGTLLGTSGKSGFTSGTPHLHFEVRRYGRQVDPYGWYGPGPDPCAAYAGCVASPWLWHGSLLGLYDFTPPDTQVSAAQPRVANLPLPDKTPPIGTLAINPPADLRLLVHFDGTALQTVGGGFPVGEGEPAFEEGRYDKGLRLPSNAGLTYPISENLRLQAGTISLWAKVPERYPPTSTGRHYLFAASANADDDNRIYTGTLALRRELTGPGAAPQWNFWTTPQSGEIGRNDLTAPDTLGPGWRHFAVTWDAAEGSKALYLDGALVASTRGITLPVDVGPVLQLSRFTYGGRMSGTTLDDLAIYGRALGTDEIRALARADAALAAGAPVLTRRGLVLDTNAIDAEGGIVAVQLGRNGVFDDPRPYYDAFRWSLPPVEGSYDLAVRYFDRASNTTTVTQTVTLDLPPRGRVTLADADDVGATLVISATDAQLPIEMQFSEHADFSAAQWQPLRERVEWQWQSSQPRRLYMRLRDAGGQISSPITVVATHIIYFPMVGRL